MVIAVENYVDPAIPRVKYATTDAVEFAAVLRQHEIEVPSDSVLIDVQATKAQVWSRLRAVVGNLTDDDTFFLYYAGHGFAKDAKRNFITCHDTRITDLRLTSIAMDAVFGLLRNSDCQRIAAFLDCCESGLLANAEMRGIYTDLTESELEAFFESGEHCVCFTACKAGESSWPAEKLKHGIWTHHLIEALSGQAPLALEKKSLITSSSLQNYLRVAVPKSVRTLLNGNQKQTPWIYGGQGGDFLIVDVAPLLAKRAAEANPHLRQLKRVVLYREVLGDVKRLSGFRKRYHTVPDAVTSATQSFIQDISAAELKQDLAEKFAALQKAFKLKRRDITVQGPDEGCGSLITPYFDYDVTVRLNPQNTGEVLWRHEILNIREPGKVFCAEFDAAFSGVFDTLEFQFLRSVNVADVIDTLEALEDPPGIEYPPSCAYCKITTEGGVVTVTKDAIAVSDTGSTSPKALVEGFFAVQRLLVNQHQMKQLPFNMPKDSHES
jgi:hypothetical protein